MKAGLIVGIAMAFVFGAIASDAGAQATESRERPVSGISFGGRPGMRNGIPHPASLALAYFDSLHLTPEQVQELRDIQDRVEEAMMEELLAHLQEGPRLPGLMWSQEPPDPDQVRARFQEQAEAEAAMFLRLLAGRDEVFRVLSPDQKETLLGIHRDRYSRTAQPNPEAPPSRPCTRGGAGGGGTISDRVAMVYSVDFHGDSAQVGAVFVGKADGKLHSSPSPGPRPQLPDGPRFLSGGAIGIWHLGYDEDSHTAWVQDRRISLEYGNVILLEGVERLQEPPRLAGIAKLPSMIYTGGCPPGRSWSIILREELQKVPEIREFMESKQESSGG